MRAKLPAGVSKQPVPLARCGPGILVAARFPAAGAATGPNDGAAGLVVTVSRSAPGACRAAGCAPVNYSSPLPSRPEFPAAYSGACGTGCTRVWVYADGRVATVTASGVARDPSALARVAQAALTAG